MQATSEAWGLGRAWIPLPPRGGPRMGQWTSIAPLSALLVSGFTAFHLGTLRGLCVLLVLIKDP